MVEFVNLLTRSRRAFVKQDTVDHAVEGRQVRCYFFLYQLDRCALSTILDFSLSFGNSLLLDNNCVAIVHGPSLNVRMLGFNENENNSGIKEPY